MLLTGQVHVKLCIFFQRSFLVSILSPFFNPEAPLDEIPLYMVHSVFTPPPPPPSPSTSMEIDPFELWSSSSASTPEDNRHSRGSLEVAGVMENDFYTLELD